MDAKLKVGSFAHDLVLLEFESVKDIYKADFGKWCQGFVHDLSDAVGARHRAAAHLHDVRGIESSLTTQASTLKEKQPIRNKNTTMKVP